MPSWLPLSVLLVDALDDETHAFIHDGLQIDLRVMVKQCFIDLTKHFHQQPLPGAFSCSLGAPSSKCRNGTTSLDSELCGYWTQ